ncbi:surface-adhesin E family protein [Saezia sanguinis]|uniref:surface-adhesin E family protein n=1 Tax=Saezia sanguinis TaxID=1965230 RepID=UPI0030D9AD8C
MKKYLLILSICAASFCSTAIAQTRDWVQIPNETIYYDALSVRQDHENENIFHVLVVHHPYSTNNQIGSTLAGIDINCPDNLSRLSGLLIFYSQKFAQGQKMMFSEEKGTPGPWHPIKEEYPIESFLFEKLCPQ